MSQPDDNVSSAVPEISLGKPSNAFAGSVEFITYEYLDEYGDVPPHNENVRAQLFDKLAKFSTAQGEHMTKLTELKVEIQRNDGITAIKKFEDAGLHPVMLENIEACGYTLPTPIQSVCIPAILQGKQLLVCAQTGTGKTAAFLIPIFSRLMGKYKTLAAPRAGMSLPKDEFSRAEPLVLIIAPTRELALQTYDHCRRLSYRTMLRPVCVFGGGEMTGPNGQMTQLQYGCDILIATLGRLVDLLSDPLLISLRRVKFTVLDEADNILSDTEDAGKIDRVLFGGDANLDADHKLLMFSATFSEKARQVAAEYMGPDHPVIYVGRFGSSHGNIQHEIIEVEHFNKRQKLYEILSQADNMRRTIIFCNAKPECDRLDDFLFNKGLPVLCTHSGRAQIEREIAMRKFRDGEKPILVTTAMFSRGIDIADVSQVINYDMPSIAHGGIDEFVHRIGRTARMGNVGHALSFMTDRNDDIAPDLVQLIMEVGQDVPPFLAHHIPNDGDVETATVADAAGDTEGAWGATDKEDFFSGEESKQAEGPGSW